LHDDVEFLVAVTARPGLVVSGNDRLTGLALEGGPGAERADV